MRVGENLYLKLRLTKGGFQSRVSKILYSNKNPFIKAPLFQNILFTVPDSIKILGVKIATDVQFYKNLECKAKLDLKKLRLLNRVSTLRLTVI